MRQLNVSVLPSQPGKWLCRNLKSMIARETLQQYNFFFLELKASRKQITLYQP